MDIDRKSGSDVTSAPKQGADTEPHSGDPRPLRADARRNRARLLEVAHEVFAAEGLSVPIDEIARKAGVGPGTIYRHFATKEALFEAVIKNWIERLLDEARSLRTASDPGAAFFDFFAHMVEEATGNKALSESFAMGGEKFELEDQEDQRDLERALDELLRRAQQAGAVRADVKPSDIKALLVGCMATEMYGVADADNRILAVVRDGLMQRG
jgi:AcrR family transcriptional regulator